MDKKLAELVGICIGDGCISINQRYHEFAISGDLSEEREYYDNHVVPLFNECIAKPFFNKEVMAKEDPSNGVYGFHIFNKDLVQKLLDLGLTKSPKTNVKIPKKFMGKELIPFVLKGLFDTDGTVYFNKATSGKYSQPRISLGSISTELVQQVKEALISMGFKPMNKKPYKGKRDKNTVHYVQIYLKKDIDRWMDLIGFNNPKHLTKILTWKNFGFCQPNTSLEERKCNLYMLCQT